MVAGISKTTKTSNLIVVSSEESTKSLRQECQCTGTEHDYNIPYDPLLKLYTQCLRDIFFFLAFLLIYHTMSCIL